MPRTLVILLVTCSAVVCIPLWTVAYLPMVDLPQHAAQVAIWSHWNDASYGYHAIYESNWFTPYLFGYSLIYALHLFLPIKIAIKLLLTLALFATPWCMLRFLRQSGDNPWWTFAIFPGLFGYSFVWGFFNFVLGTPLVLLFLALVAHYARAPTRQRGLWVALSACGLFFVHLLLLAYALLIAGLIVLGHATSIKNAVRALLPLTIPVPVALLWMWATRAANSSAQQVVTWELDRVARIHDLIGESVGEEYSPKILALAMVVFLLPWLVGGRPQLRLFAWAPFVATAAIVLFFPTELFGTAFVHARFAVFVVPMWLYAWQPAPSPLRSPLRELVGPALVFVFTIALLFRFWGFERETRGYDQVAKLIPPHSKVLYLPIVNHSLYVRGHVFLQFAQWNAAEHGGTVDFSFAQYFPPIFRYKPEIGARRAPLDFEWSPLTFNWQRHHGSEYDYFLARSPGDYGPALFRNTTEPVQLVAHSDLWWLYKRVH